MFALLTAIPGVLNGLLGYLQKRADTELVKYTTGVQADTQVILKQVDADIARQQAAKELRQADRGSLWTCWMMPTAFFFALSHFAAIVLDSIFKFSWAIDKLPPPYDTVQQSIILTGCGIVGVGSVVRRIFTR